jgi:isopenicillin-N N-acyltransferase-like protein
MRGIADGAGVRLLDIVALNVRTEINFGLFSDGCTSLAWLGEKRTWLAQNWDVCGLHPAFHHSQNRPTEH